MPSYAVVVELIKLGMTIEEIFGKEVSEIIFKNSNSNLPGDGFDSPEFRKGVEKAIEDMKARGLI